jgi:hypothetical protein
MCTSLQTAAKESEGKEGNWIQAIPGKSYNVLFQLYGPLKPCMGKAWKIGDLELVE